MRCFGKSAALLITLALSVLAGCAQPSGQGGSMVVPAPADTVCTEPRPMVCTMEYRPVCASLAVGSEKTYPSGCNACADIAVSSWRDGPCEER